MGTTDVTVPVPSDRVPEFYRWFADWVDRGAAGPAPSPAEAIPQQNLDAAVRWWKTLKPRERNIFSLWIEAAPRMLSATEIIQQLGLKGPREIAGILSWPGRKGVKAGFAVRWSFRYDPTTEEPMYGIEDPDYAELIERARTAAERD
jgi:hypothetical protein